LRAGSWGERKKKGVRKRGGGGEIKYRGPKMESQRTHKR